jgi:hypothetical protein
MEAGMLPRTLVRTIDAPPAIAVPLDSTRLLIAAESFRGTAAPMRFSSPRDVSRYLERTGVGIPAWDAIDVAMREGVSEVWLARILGPAAASASIALAGASGTSFTISAHEPGEWANGAAGGLTAEVVNGPGGASERVVIIRRVTPPTGTGPVEIGRTTAETTRADLILAVERIGRVTLPGGEIRPLLTVAAGADTTLPAVAAAANYTGGDSDSDGVTTTHVRAALDLVSIDEGPMSVATPGRNTDATNEEILGHCSTHDRTALLEQASGLAVGTITASAAVLRALGSGAEGIARLGGLWKDHLTGPGLVPGTTRTVPATIVVAGLIARLERAEGHPNVAPFGDFGTPRWATTVVSQSTEADAETLFAAGCNVWTSYLGVPRNRTFRTLEEFGTSEWVDLAHTRLERAVRAHARDVGRGMGSRVINRATISDFGALLRQRLEALWKAGALFGATPDEAFRVDVDSVNDTTSIAAHEVNAAVGLKMAEHAEYVNIDLAKVPIGQEV